MLKGIIQRLVGVLGMALAGFGVYHCGSSSDSDHVTFIRLDPAALDAALSTKKPVVIYVTSPSDAACKTQDDGALKDPKVIEALTPFVRFKLVTGSQAARMNQMFSEQMAAEMNAFALPMFHFMSPAGVQTSVLLGVQSADSLLAAAAKALKP